MFALSTNEPIGSNMDNRIEHSKKVRRSMLGVAHSQKFAKQKAPILYFYKIGASEGILKDS